MAYDVILTALADPTRRAVLDRLRDGALPVGRIAEGLPVSRPAVSQHLKVLLEAGLVGCEARGTRNLYALRPGGAEPLAAWLGDLVERPAERCGARREVVVPLPPRDAWALLVEDLATWWPVGRVSVSAEAGALPQAVVLEGRVGGVLREVTVDGGSVVWGEVVDWAEGRVAFDWRLGEADRVVWSVARVAEGARVVVEFGEGGAMWEVVVERYGVAARAGVSVF